MSTNQRKLDHINIVLEKDVDDNLSVWDEYDLPYTTLPETDLEDVKTDVEFLWKTLSFPFIISSMTGGPEKGEMINRHLAEASEQAWVALGLGSMRVVIEKPETVASFDVRQYCPSIPLFANLGIVQLNYGYWADEINRLIDCVKADGIFLHINPLQEAVQPEWDTNFNDLIVKLEKILPKIEWEVIIKETGNGMDYETAKLLYEIWVNRIDVSGRWWTSWPAVEWERRQDRLGKTIRHLWIRTDDSLAECSEIDGLHLIAWWWVRTWVDIFKAQCLWAEIATAASPFLRPALESSQAVYDELMLWKREYQIAKWSTKIGE